MVIRRFVPVRIAVLLLTSVVGCAAHPLKKGTLYGVIVSAAAATSSARVEISDGAGLVATKTLHPLDSDLYITLRARSNGEGAVSIRPLAAGIKVEWYELPVDGDARAVISEQARVWTSAQRVHLGQVIHGSADERPYIVDPALGRAVPADQGIHWFKVRNTDSRSRLVFFVLETDDRDVPADVQIFVRDAGGELTLYAVGAHNYVPEATQNLPGLASYRTSVLAPGVECYIRVAANHPAYRLRLQDFDVPSYSDPRQAVRTGMSFLVNLGDAWLGNIPRRGSVPARELIPHAEAQSCVACHPTQFTSRAYLTALEKGYANSSPEQIGNLITQLGNNPRPFYGQPDTAWSRVIFSASTVSSRLPVLLDGAARAGVAAQPPVELVRGFGNFLRLHYDGRDRDGRDRLPPEEPDGASPAVSPFEIALQTWKTFQWLEQRTPGAAGWLARRERIAELIAAGEPANVIDLNWKIVALAEVLGRGEAKKLVGRLMAEQLPDGRFGYQFGRKGPGADFITYHALYALAKAGLTEDDERVARLVNLCLKAQLPSGGWQGDPAYKSFHTPFRESQFAVMALAELFPAKNSGEPAPPPPATVDGLLEWLGGKPTPGKAAELLRTHPSVLVRAESAVALGRLGLRESIEPLAGALADPSKLVQRAAARALRRFGGHPEAAQALTAALRSGDARRRWGALSVFSRHFREFTNHRALLDAVIAASEDASPANRFLAAGALSRWYPWRTDHAAEADAILSVLARRAAAEPDAIARGAAMQGLYNALDENLGYLEAWQRAIPSERERTFVTLGREELAARQARILAGLIPSGPRNHRLNLLMSLWDIPVRHFAIPPDNQGKSDVILPVYQEELLAGVPRLHEPEYRYEPYEEAARFSYKVANAFHRTRVGNDSDLIDFSGAGPELEAALLGQVASGDAEIAVAAIKAASTLGRSLSPKFTIAMLDALGAGPPEVRAAIRFVFEDNVRASLTLGDPDRPAPGLAEALDAALRRRDADTLAIALPLMASVPPGAGITLDWKLQDAVEKLLHSPPREFLGEVLEAAAVFRRVSDGPLMRAVMLEALTSAVREVYQAGVRVMVRNYLADITMPALTDQFIAAARGPVRRYLLDSLDPDRFALRLEGVSSYNPGRVVIPSDSNLFSADRVQFLIAESLRDPDEDVRAAATDIVTDNPKLRQVAVIREALDSAVPGRRARPKQAAASGPALDKRYFVEKVQPILARIGKDGKACVMCHATHGIFPLRVPAGSGSFSEAQSEANYRFALRVVDVERPRRSLLLIKPTRPNDAAGDQSLYLSTHNGGERWAGNESSAEYETIISWIRGAK